MSDDIFIKHGLGAFQQPYIGRASVNAQEPVIAQRDARTPADARQPGTYQHRSPGTYQLPASAQTPFIRNAQTPNIRGQQQPLIKNAQEPNIRDQQNPFIRNYQTPFTYQHRTPTIYQNSYQSQQPGTYQHQSPSISRSPRNYQVPFTYQHRSPSTQPVIARTPVIYQHRSPAITTYRHPTSSVVQSTYQVTKNQQNPFIRNNQTPFTYQFRSPFIQGYQLPYATQQTTPGFLTVGRTEGVARISELITGFGTGNGIPNDNNTINSNKQGAGSILLSNYEFDLTQAPEGEEPGLAAALSGGGITFNVSYSGNDVVIQVKEGAPIVGPPRMSRIGNMSTTSSGSFSYTSSNISSTSFSEICRFTNIGSGRGQVKLNFPDPTASPYNINTGTSSSGWKFTDVNYHAEGTTSDGDSHLDYCTPITWPRTTLASPYFQSTTTNTSSDTTESVAYHYHPEPGNTSNTITTSYQNINTTNGNGFAMGLLVGATSDSGAGSSGDEEGISSIVEIIVKDLDGGAEHKCDLLIIFAIKAEAESSEGDEPGV